MMRPYRPSAAAAITIFMLLLGLHALPSRAANHMITANPSLTFSPATLTITAGDTVTFSNPQAGFHDVHADDDSFRCAAGCDGDGKGGNGDPASVPWSFTLTFSKAGTVGYHCEIHGSPGGGMHGTITVNPAQGPPPPPAAGTLGFSRSAFSVAENAGNVTIVVQRTAGSGGAVSAKYATANGTGTAGTHYRSTSGTLNWADGDSADKNFQVPVIDDGQVDGSHTVNLTLTNPSGGATLGTASSVLTITNTDTTGPPPPPPPPTAPAAPTGLTATPVDTANIQLAWTLNSTNETAVRVQSKPLDGSAFQDLLPVLAAGTNQLTVSGLSPATGYGFRVRAENAAGSSAFTPEVDAATLSTPVTCVADANTLCLGATGRFKVTVAWNEGNGTQGLGSAIPLAANPDSGLFYFFGASNIEMLIKVLNACSPPFNDYWVFFAATTNVQFTVTVVDTVSNQTRVYFNPLNQAALPVQDTSAFQTCP